MLPFFPHSKEAEGCRCPMPSKHGASLPGRATNGLTNGLAGGVTGRAGDGLDGVSGDARVHQRRHTGTDAKRMCTLSASNGSNPAPDQQEPIQGAGAVDARPLDVQCRTQVGAAVHGLPHVEGSRASNGSGGDVPGDSAHGRDDTCGATVEAPGVGGEGRAGGGGTLLEHECTTRDDIRGGVHGEHLTETNVAVHRIGHLRDGAAGECGCGPAERTQYEPVGEQHCANTTERASVARFGDGGEAERVHAADRPGMHNDTTAFIAVAVRFLIQLRYPEFSQLSLMDQCVIAENSRVLLWLCHQALSEKKGCNAIWKWHRKGVVFDEMGWRWATKCDPDKSHLRCPKHSKAEKRMTRAASEDNILCGEEQRKRKQPEFGGLELERQQSLHLKKCGAMESLIFALQLAANKDRRERVQHALQVLDAPCHAEELPSHGQPCALHYLPLECEGGLASFLHLSQHSLHETDATASFLRAPVCFFESGMGVSSRCIDELYARALQLNRNFTSLLQTGLISNYSLGC